MSKVIELASPEPRESYPMHIQMRLAVATEHAQANADRVSNDIESDLPQLQKEIRSIQARGVPLRQAMKRLRALASRWGEIVGRYSACVEGCSHCCHIPVTISSLEAECMGQEISRTPLRAPKKPKKQLAGYDNPCPFLVDSRCSIYESRPLVCRTHHNMDSDDLLCRLVDGASIPVPYADARALQLVYWKLSQKSHIGDIREFFPRESHPVS